MTEKEQIEQLYLYYEWGEELLVMELIDKGGYVYDMDGKLYKLKEIRKEELEKVHYESLSEYGLELIRTNLNNFEDDKTKLHN